MSDFNDEQEQPKEGFFSHLFGSLGDLVGHRTQVASMSNQNVIVGNSGAVSVDPQPQIIHITVLSAVATSLNSVTDPSTGYTNNTAVTPLFTVVEAIPPGANPLPTFTVTLVNPATTLSATAISFSSVSDPVTGINTTDAVTPLFRLHGSAVPGVPIPTVTITLTIP